MGFCLQVTTGTFSHFCFLTGLHTALGILVHTESFTSSQTWWGTARHLVMGFCLQVTTGTFSHFCFLTGLHTALGTCLQIVSVTTEQTWLERVEHLVSGSCLQFLTGNLMHFSRGSCSHTSLSEHCFTGTSLQIVLVCNLAHSADLSLLTSPPEVS